jgi:hypothetical protein
MKKFIERFSSLVKRTITGFDRTVFKGFVLPLMAASGAMQFWDLIFFITGPCGKANGPPMAFFHRRMH